MQNKSNTEFSIIKSFFCIKTFDRVSNRITISNENITMELTIISDDIIRFRYLTDDSRVNYFSYAISNYSFTRPQVHTEENEDTFTVLTDKLECLIAKTDFKVTIRDKRGNVINEDQSGFIYENNIENGGYNVSCCKKIQTDEYFYGLGDKTSDLNLKGKSFTNWNSDTPAYGRLTDPLYRTIPFYLGLTKKKAYGIFLDNSFKSHFDFGREQNDTCKFSAEGGDMCYYFIYGPGLISVSEKYTLLTGTPDLPPLWALGFQQSKWSYTPQARVKEIASTFRKKKIPCDVIYLDIDYMDAFRCFTWHPEHFRKPQKLISQLAEKGFKTIVIIDPGIKTDTNYSTYNSGIEEDIFCRRADGAIKKGPVWPGMCAFPDFTSPKARDWWVKQFPQLLELGISGIWNDMNEPAVFTYGTFHNDVRHVYDGEACSHRKAHNVYGMLMSKASYDALLAFNPEKRPFSLTRASYSGGQRYAAVWTGDNISNWEHLFLANIQCQRLAVSGFSFCGSDTGGFVDYPDGKLMARWIQMSIFHPFFRAHSSGEKGDKEPWAFGEEIEAINKKFIELRYKLLPYIYTAFYQYVKRGTPMLRPLAFLDQFDPDTLYRMEEFAIGDNLLISPVMTPDSLGRWTYLPYGTWFNYWTDTQHLGGKEIWCATPLDVTPIFVKAGAVIPMYPVQQYVGQIDKIAPALHIYYDSQNVFSEIYEDCGEGFGYKSDEYLLRSFLTCGSYDHFEIVQSRTGSFCTKYDQITINLHGIPFALHSVIADGEKIKLKKLKSVKPTYQFTTKENFKILTFKANL